MKKKKRQSVFFVDPSVDDISEQEKNKIETIVESRQTPLGKTPLDTEQFSGNFGRVIDNEYDSDQKKDKKTLKD